MVEEADTDIIAEVPTDPEHLCRLCLNHHQFVTNIFEDKSESKSLPMLLFELFQIKYEISAHLPQMICQRCMYMVKEFSNFRQNVFKCESELQAHVEALQQKPRSYFVLDETPRAGLNGQPGCFEPEEDCTITEVDPKMEYESSDDEFSMESESEMEAASPTSNIAAQSVNKTVMENSFESTNMLPSSTALSNPNFAASNSYVGSSTTTMVDSMGLEYTVKNTFLCQYCDMAFTTHQECVEHETSVHDPAAPYQCNFCPFRHTNRQNLIQHIKESHDQNRPYVCALCNKGFGRRSDLKKHTIVHTGVRPFSCPVCGKSFSRNTNLTKHMRIHSSVKPHVCHQCPRSFQTAAELQRHSRTHGASFARKDKQQSYENSMENMVPLNAFSAENELNAYGNNNILAAQLQQKPSAMVTAPTAVSTPRPSNSRNHTCTICFKSFTRERDLQRHQALHLDMLFTCKQCGESFSRREKLARHELEHGPQYGCNICGNTYYKRDEYEVHMKVHKLQQNVAMTTHAATQNHQAKQTMHHQQQQQQQFGKPTMPPTANAAAEMSFYSQMIPTMNLGFYSETRPDE